MPFQLDIQTGRICQIGLGKAGSGEDLWPQDIEDDVMSADSPAATVYQRKIQGQNRIILTAKEKFTFASWLALFMMRTPSTLKAINEMTESVNTNPAAMIPFLFEGDSRLSVRAEVLEKIEREHPDIYNNTISEYGQQDGEELLLLEIFRLTLEGKINWSANAQHVRDIHLRTTELDSFATILCDKYRWRFLRTEQSFIVGDNPLVRWHGPSHRWNYGIRMKGVEITMPLAKNLMLQLSQTQRRSGDCWVQPIGRTMRRHYNRRQRIAALRYVYGAEGEHLCPFALLKASVEELRRWEVKPPMWEYLTNAPTRMQNQ